MGAASHEVIFLQAGPRGKFIFYFHSLKRPFSFPAAFEEAEGKRAAVSSIPNRSRCRCDTESEGERDNRILPIEGGGYGAQSSQSKSSGVFLDLPANSQERKGIASSIAVFFCSSVRYRDKTVCVRPQRR